MIPHLVSVDQFHTDHIQSLFATADELEKYSATSGVALPRSCEHRVCTNLFYEPSTRTSSSFHSAMVRLGGSVIPINDVAFSSVSKGETLEDTIQVIQRYSDVIVLRHPQQGAAARAAAVCTVPIINAGDGQGEHPTQALLDLYTIHKHHDLTSKLRVALVGDLLYGRTVHSLLKLLRLYNTEIHLVSPHSLGMPEHMLRAQDHVHASLQECIHHMDVVYVTRVQQERFTQPHVWCNSNYQITPCLMKSAPLHLTLMHPLPRMDEIVPTVDADPRARYFEQISHGLTIRQAIFHCMFSTQGACWLPAVCK